MDNQTRARALAAFHQKRKTDFAAAAESAGQSASA
jgi:hypothetical protein